MKGFVEFLKSKIQMHEIFIFYVLVSLFVTLFDVITCRICEIWISSVLANTVGVTTGFALQYFITTRCIYKEKNFKTFFVFLWTFAIGLAVANSIVYIFREFVYDGSDSAIAFIVSKALSSILPFYLMYFLRKKFIPTTNKKQKK